MLVFVVWIGLGMLINSVVIIFKFLLIIVGCNMMVINVLKVLVIIVVFIIVVVFVSIIFVMVVLLKYVDFI